MLCLHSGPKTHSFKAQYFLFFFHFLLGHPMSRRPLCCYRTASLCSYSCPFVSGDITSVSRCFHTFRYVFLLMSLSDVRAPLSGTAGTQKVLKYLISTTYILGGRSIFLGPCFATIKHTFLRGGVMQPYCVICLISHLIIILYLCINHLNAELIPICHLLALLGGATIVVVSRLRVNKFFNIY
jgi:hypothetical protein